MPTPEATSVVQAELTGLNVETFQTIIAHPKLPLSLEAIATTDHPKLIGKRLGETAFAGHPSLDQVPIIGMEDAINNTDSTVVFSGLENDKAAKYEDLLAEGRWLATTASANSGRDDVALFNAYIGGTQLDELHNSEVTGRIFANGSPASIIAGVVLAPLEREIGIQAINPLETLQGWSGRGESEVPEANRGDISSLDGDARRELETEPQKFLGTLSLPLGFRTYAKPNQAPWADGHHVRTKLRMDKPTSPAEIEEIVHAVKGPPELKGVKYGKNSPKRRPIKLVHEPLLKKSTANFYKLHPVKPMRVVARLIEVSGNDNDVVELEMAGDNLVLGGAGSIIMNIMYAKRKGYLK